MTENNYLNTKSRYFIKKYFTDMYSVTRLNDRFFREKLSGSRKIVYLIQNNLDKKNILLKFSKKYKKIFINHTIALHYLGKFLFKKEWIIDEANLLIKMPYFGKNLSIEDNKSRNKIVNLLKKINGPPNFDFFKVPRYISDVIKLNSTKPVFNFIILEKVINLMEKKRIAYGYGVEDPSFNNFTIAKNKVFLVDLDNFDTAININYEIGFLDADIDITSGKSSIENSKFDHQYEMYLFGYISRYSTILIDYLSGKKIDSKQIIFCKKVIKKTCLHLLKILS